MNRNLLMATAVLSGFWPGVARALWISEVLYDAEGADAGRVFVELYGVPGTALAGFALEGVNGSNGARGPLVELSGVIPDDGFFVVAGESGGATEVPNADLVLPFDFQNGPDSIRLLDAADQVVDAVGYGVFAPGEIFAGEGAPAPDPGAGQSIARLFADLDTDDNAADFAALASPTPGTGALQLPEPLPLGLLLCGGTALGLRRGTGRRRRRD